MKKKFKSILKLRKMREKDVSIQMVRLQKKLDEDEQELHRLESVVVDRDQRVEALVGNGASFSPHDLRLQSEYLGHVNAAVRQQHEVVEDRSRNVDDKRQELGDAARERKIVETLQDRAWEEARSEARRKETKELDETATVRHSR